MSKTKPAAAAPAPEPKKRGRPRKHPIKPPPPPRPPSKTGWLRVRITPEEEEAFESEAVPYGGTPTWVRRIRLEHRELMVALAPLIDGYTRGGEMSEAEIRVLRAYMRATAGLPADAIPG